MFGRAVHYVFGSWEGGTGNVAHQCRPAVIVNTWGSKPPEGCYNLQVFVDGSNDFRSGQDLFWATSRGYSRPMPFAGGAAPEGCLVWEGRTLFRPGTWHFADECHRLS